MSLLMLFNNLYKNSWLPKVTLCISGQKLAVLSHRCQHYDRCCAFGCMQRATEQQPGRTCCTAAHPHSATHCSWRLPPPRVTHYRSYRQEKSTSWGTTQYICYGIVSTVNILTQVFSHKNCKLKKQNIHPEITRLMSRMI